MQKPKIVAGSSNKERKLLDKMVRTPYPHNTFPNGPYDRTTEDVINKGNADQEMLMMRDGLRDLEKNFGDLSQRSN